VRNCEGNSRHAPPIGQKVRSATRTLNAEIATPVESIVCHGTLSSTRYQNVAEGQVKHLSTVVVLIGLSIACSSRARINHDCQWTHDALLSIDLRDTVHQTHLRHDADLMETSPSAMPTNMPPVLHALGG